MAVHCSRVRADRTSGGENWSEGMTRAAPRINPDRQMQVLPNMWNSGKKRQSRSSEVIFILSVEARDLLRIPR